MAISFVNKSAFASGTSALSVAAVTNVQAGDLILLFVESANQVVTLPSGFTGVTGSPVSTGTAAAAGGVRLAVYYRLATGADTTTTVNDTGDHTTAIKIAYRGVNQTTPFDATAVAGTKATASTSSSFPGITTATPNAWVVHASALDLDAASTATTGAPTNANLTGLTERHDQTVTLGFGGGLVIIDGLKAAAGASGNTTATVTSTIQVYLTVALRAKIGTGTFAATETDADTLFATVGGVISGDGAATETGSDTASAAGQIIVRGVFAATEAGADTLTVAGKVLVRGAMAVTEAGQDTLTASGKVIVKGSLAATETSADTLQATGADIVTSTGTMAATESGLDALAAAGQIIVRGVFAATEAGADTLSAAGQVAAAGVSGVVAATEAGADAFGGVSGTVTGQPADEYTPVIGGVTTGRPFMLPQYAPPFTGRSRKKRQADVLFLGL